MHTWTAVHIGCPTKYVPTKFKTKPPTPGKELNTDNQQNTSGKQKKTPYWEICVRVLSYNPAVSTWENACGDSPKADKYVGKLESLL